MDMIKQPAGWQLVTSLQLTDLLYSWKLNVYDQTAGWLTTCQQPAADRPLVLLKIKWTHYGLLFYNQVKFNQCQPQSTSSLLDLNSKSISGRSDENLSTSPLFDHINIIFKSTRGQSAAGWWQVVNQPAVWSYPFNCKSTRGQSAAGCWQVVNRPAVWPYPFNFQEYKRPLSCGLVTSCQLTGCLIISI